MKRLWNLYIEAQNKANEAEKAFESNPTNKGLEDAFDVAYAEEHKRGEALAEKIAEVAQLDIRTVRSMLIHKHNELASIIERIA